MSSLCFIVIGLFVGVGLYTAPELVGLRRTVYRVIFLLVALAAIIGAKLL